MLTALVINLKALQDGFLPPATGHFVRGLWLKYWDVIDKAYTQILDSDHGVKPFTISQLINLPKPKEGKIPIQAGMDAWMRITLLHPILVERTLNEWLSKLPDVVELGRIKWQLVSWTVDRRDHELAGQGAPEMLLDLHLKLNEPPASWVLEFNTPTTFSSGKKLNFPFPSPYLLVRSWLQKWSSVHQWYVENGQINLVRKHEEYGGVFPYLFRCVEENISKEFLYEIENGLAVSQYELMTIPIKTPRKSQYLAPHPADHTKDKQDRLVIGCVGLLKLDGNHLSIENRRAVDLLSQFAFWAGSGQHTAEGFGTTIPPKRG